MGHSLQQLQQLRVTIVRNTALLSKVVVVRGNKLADGHNAGRLALQQVYNLATELDELWVAYWTLAALNPWLWKMIEFFLMGISEW